MAASRLHRARRDRAGLSGRRRCAAERLWRDLMGRVIAIGGLTMDWVQASSTMRGPSLGGNAAYAAAGARLAGGDGEIVATIGDDYPMELLTQLADVGIGTANIRVVPGPSFRVLLDERGPRRMISYLPGSGRNDR